MTMTVGGPFLIAVSIRYLNRFKDNAFLLFTMRFLLIIISSVAFALFLVVKGEELAQTSTQYLEEASVTQDDFANNTIYTGARYNLEITDFSTLGLVKIAPKAILIAFYRPVIWEARSALLIISGLETTLFIYLTLAFFFRGSVLKKIKAVRSNELLSLSAFCLP